jgi:hypothetical protein
MEKEKKEEKPNLAHRGLEKPLFLPLRESTFPER